MSTVLWLVLNVVFLTLGQGLGMFLLISPLICLFFGIPTALRFKRQGILVSNVPLIKYFISMLLLPTIFAGIAWLIWHYAPTYWFVFAFGAAIALFVARGQLGTNPSNMRDFVTTNAKYMNPTIVESLLEPKDD